MPTMQFEDAVNRVMTKAKLDRADAIQQIRGLRDDGTLDESVIPDLNHNLAYESMASMGTGFVRGAYETAMTPVRKFADIVGGSDMASEFAPPSPESSMHEKAPASEFAGSMAGAMPYFQTLGTATEGLPIIGGASMGKQMIRGALEGYPLSKMGLFGDMSTPAAMATGFLTPPVTRMLAKPFVYAGSKIGSTFTDLLAKAGKKSAGTVAESVAKPVEAQAGPTFSDLLHKVAGLPDEEAETVEESTPHEKTQQAAAEQRSGFYGNKPAPVQSADAGATFDIAPPEPTKPGYLMTAEEKLKLKDREPVGTMTVREGEPFKAEFMRPVQSRGGARVYHDYRNPAAASAVPRSLAIDNPRVLHVDSTGEEAYREAVRQAYPDSSRVLDAIDGAANPREAAVEALGRFAKNNGHDAVVINTPDTKENVILQYKNFSPSWQEDLNEPGWEKRGIKLMKRINEGGGETAKAKKPISRDNPSDKSTVIKQEQQEQQMKQAVEAQVEFNGSPPIDGHKRAVESPGMFDPEINKEIDDSQRMRRKPAAWIRLPSNVSDHPAYKAYIADIFDYRRQVFGQARRRFEGVLKRITKGATAEDYDKMVYSVEGLERHETPDGKLELRQTRPDADPTVADRASRFRNFITDKAYSLITGNAPETFTIMEQHGLPHTRPEFERLRAIQNGQAVPTVGGIAGLDAKAREFAEQTAAARLKGMLNFDSTHDLDWNTIEGYFPHNPIDNERAFLQDLVVKAREYEKMGMYNGDARFTHDYAVDATKRLQELDAELLADERRRLPARDTFPRRHYAGPINLALNPKAAAFKYKTNVAEVGSDYVQTILAKRFNDYMLGRTRQLLAQFPDMDPAMKDYITTYVNTVRGARGFRGDALTADTVNALGRAAGRLTGQEFKPINAGDIHRGVSALMDFNFLSKLSLTPLRFPIINLTHSLTTTWTDVGSGVYAKALMRVLSDPESAFKRGMAAGIINERSSFLDEVGTRVGTMPGPVRRTLGGISAFTEKLRFMVDYEAALEQYRRGEVSPIVSTYVKEKAGRTELQAMREYARAHVDTFQFRQGVENKPLAFTGSSAARLATQFRTWSVNLGAISGNIVKSGDIGRITRLGTALTFFGGLPVWFGGPTLFKMVRRELLKQGVDLPEQNGLQVIADQFGLQQSLGEFSLYSLQDPYSIDVPAQVMTQNAAAGMLGPTFGSVIDLSTSEYKNFMEKGSFSATPLVNLISPQLKAGLEAAGEYKAGGVFGPDGAIESNKPWAANVMRGLDLASSARSQRYNMIEDIAAAVESGNRELVASLQKQAEQKGIIVNDKFVESIKSVVRRHKKAGRETTYQEIMGN